MRTVLLGATLALLLVLAPLALADGEDGRTKAEKHRAEAQTRHAEAETNDTDDDANETARAGHASARASARENRSTAREAFLSGLADLRASWHENATAIRDGCRSSEFDRENATKEQKTEWAHCIQDGYASWRESHRAEIKDLREQLRELLRSFHLHGKHAGS